MSIGSLLYKSPEGRVEEQIKEKYPNQWVGLVDCEMEDSINVRSAVVKYTEKDMSSDLMALETVKGNMKAIYTTPNDTSFSGTQFE